MTGANELTELIAAAEAARAKAYAPYSGFTVGAALKTAAGRIFTGANVENVSYGLSLCAERVAIAKAVAEGEREFDVLVVATEGAGSASLCGACRQFLAEFSPGCRVVTAAGGRVVGDQSLRELLPHAFRL